MAKKKVCKRCKIFVDDEKCPICKDQVPASSNNWQGRIFVLNYRRSEIANKMGLCANGEFAIKVR